MGPSAQLIGPLPDVGAQRVAWDPSGGMALTLADDDRLLGLSVGNDVVEAPVRVSTNLEWDPDAPLLAVLGDLVLVDGSGAVRVDAEQGNLALAPDRRLLAVHRPDKSLRVITPDGGEVFGADVEAFEWSPDGGSILIVDGGGVAILSVQGRRSLEVDDGSRGPLNARWSPAATSVVVWGAYGPFEIRDTDGRVLRSFPAHAAGVNLAAVLGRGVLLTSGDDGRLQRHDPLAGMTLGGVHVSSPAVWLDLSADEQFISVELLDGSVAVHDLPEMEWIGPLRTATQGRWSPSAPTLACCDGRDLWIEEWS